jgi:hypothetical protein
LAWREPPPPFPGLPRRQTCVHASWLYAVDDAMTRRRDRPPSGRSSRRGGAAFLTLRGGAAFLFVTSSVTLLRWGGLRGGGGSASCGYACGGARLCSLQRTSPPSCCVVTGSRGREATTTPCVAPGRASSQAARDRRLHLPLFRRRSVNLHLAGGRCRGELASARRFLHARGAASARRRLFFLFASNRPGLA